MPATTPYSAAQLPVGFLSLGVAAATVIYAGTLVAKNSSGYAVPASDTAGLIVLGRAVETVDNSAGLAAALNITVEPGVFQYTNSGTNAVTIAHIGQLCWVEDDTIVASVAGTDAIPAGRVLGVDGNGVWVDTRGNSGPPVVVTDGTTNGAAAAAADLAALKAETELIGDLTRAIAAALRTAGIIV